MLKILFVLEVPKVVPVRLEVPNGFESNGEVVLVFGGFVLLKMVFYAKLVFPKILGLLYESWWLGLVYYLIGKMGFVVGCYLVLMFGVYLGLMIAFWVSCLI